MDRGKPENTAVLLGSVQSPASRPDYAQRSLPPNSGGLFCCMGVEVTVSQTEGHRLGPRETVKDKRWHPVPVLPRTLPALLNQEFIRLDEEYPLALPELRKATTLLVGSDYSGEATESPYSVFSFLVTSLESLGRWEPARIHIRQAYLKDSRRMSFKRLGDGQKQRALRPLLEAANGLEGLSFSIAIAKRCKSIFADRTPLDLSNPQFSAFRKWKPLVLEKAFFVLHVIGVLLGGLAAPGQNTLWFTDEDSIAANDQRVRELTQLFAWITSQYLRFMLGNCRVGTTKSDDGSRQIEDFVAIPDLIAGALAEQLAAKTGDPEIAGVFWMHRPDFSDKTRNINWWFSDARKPLKRLFCVVDPTADGNGHLLSSFHFWDQAG